MAGQISKDKKQISVVLTLDQLKRLDGHAAELGTSRAALISEAVDALLDGSPAEDAGAAKLDAISAKLDALAAAQDAADAANRLAVAGILDAVKNQPIAVQQATAELPSAEAEPPKKKKGLFGLFGRG